MPSFADLGVAEDLAQVLADRGAIEPFPIQAATLPDAIAGRDVCGKAPTGSGKTLAFGIAAVIAIPDTFISIVSVPYVQLVVYVVIAAIAGILAAILPARRAARLNVLDAISHE